MGFPVVRLNGLVFNDGPDDDGDEFWVGDIDGWDGPVVDVAVIERPPGSDGAVVAYGRASGWALVVKGSVLAANGHIGRARRKLTDAVYGLLGTDGPLQVDEDDGSYEMQVRLVQTLRTTQDGPAIDFSVSLLAPAPTKTLLEPS